MTQSSLRLPAEGVQNDRVDAAHAVDPLLEVLGSGPGGEGAFELPLVAEPAQALAQLGTECIVDLEPVGGGRGAEQLLVERVQPAQLGNRKLVVVDARLPERWRGGPNPIDRRPGRVPGALNAPWSEPLPPLPDGDVVAYCGSGVTACVVLHRLHLAGRDARLYPGSWSEWEQLDLPVERD